MKSKKNIIFIGGIHGVGKSTFVKKVKGEIPKIELLSCSKVLKWENSAYKKVEDVEGNQDRLVTNLKEIIDIDKPYLLDGHFCLLNEEGKVERIGIETFRGINPEMIILLTEDVGVIRKRLEERDNRKYDLKGLENFATEERNNAQNIAQELNIPLHILKSSEYRKIINDLEVFVSTFEEGQGDRVRGTGTLTHTPYNY